MEGNNNNSNLEPSLLASLKVVFIEWCSGTTAHAIPNIIRNGNIIIKLMWILCLLASGGYCIYSMVKSLQEFLAYPSYVSTEIVQEIPALFPAVTICNIKTISKATSKSYLTSPSFSQYIVNASATGSTLEYIIMQQYYFRTAISNDSSLTDDTRREKGFEFKNMLMSCIFNYVFCNTSEFTYFYDASFGNCYTFNKGVNQDIKSLTVSGPLYGLQLELYLGDPAIETEYEYNDGIIISVHNQSAVPFAEEGKIMIAAGTDTDVIVSRKFTSKLGPPYSDCLVNTTSTSTFSSYYFDYIVKTLGITYSQKYCFSLCMQKAIMDTCKCTNTFLPSFKGNNSYCLTPTEAGCNYVLIGNFGKSSANKDCQTACPFECNTVEYETTTNKALYPNKFYQKILADYSLIKKTNISYDDIPKAVAKVNIYYKNMLYTQTTETAAISTESFFSNMGGTLGLYIGISLLSLVEILELAINLIIAVLSYSKAKKQINSSGNKIITVQPFTMNLNS